MKYALIIANPNSDELGRIVSRHRTLLAGGQSLSKLNNSRWAYVAERRTDGGYPLRCERNAEETTEAARYEWQRQEQMR
ncbi:MAG: hypothetical protein ABL904_17100 [Hyphomicrobiaceae bacterium]